MGDTGGQNMPSSQTGAHTPVPLRSQVSLCPGTSTYSGPACKFAAKPTKGENSLGNGLMEIEAQLQYYQASERDLSLPDCYLYLSDRPLRSAVDSLKKTVKEHPRLGDG